jgi:hypothetical protein
MTFLRSQPILQSLPGKPAVLRSEGTEGTVVGNTLDVVYCDVLRCRLEELLVQR